MNTLYSQLTISLQLITQINQEKQKVAHIRTCFSFDQGTIEHSLIGDFENDHRIYTHLNYVLVHFFLTHIHTLSKSKTPKTNLTKLTKLSPQGPQNNLQSKLGSRGRHPISHLDHSSSQNIKVEYLGNFQIHLSTHGKEKPSTTETRFRGDQAQAQCIQVSVGAN